MSSLQTLTLIHIQYNQVLSITRVTRVDGATSDFTRLLAVTADNLHLVRMNKLTVAHLEGDILNQESPDLVTETVGMKMALVGRKHEHPILKENGFPWGLP